MLPLKRSVEPSQPCQGGSHASSAAEKSEGKSARITRVGSMELQLDIESDGDDDPDEVAEQDDLAAAPSTDTLFDRLSSCLEWPEILWRRLESYDSANSSDSAGSGLVANAKHALTRGLILTSSCSGLGTAEHVLSRLREL